MNSKQRLHSLRPAWFDTHAHLGDELLWDDSSLVLARAKDCGLGSILTVCTDRETLERGCLIGGEGSKIYLSAATGPNELDADPNFYPLVEESARLGRLIAIGETGLDKHWQRVELPVQIEAFIKYLDLARSTVLPVIVHCRLAFSEVIDILDRYYIGKEGALPGVFHCFSEGVDEMKEVQKRGWLVSFSGVVTYKSAICIQEAAAQVDPKHYVLETDSPYLSPHPGRRRRNEPAYCVEVAQKLAQIRGEELENIKTQTWSNSCRLFQLS
jgi:TatD DNase family protein